MQAGFLSGVGGAAAPKRSTKHSAKSLAELVGEAKWPAKTPVAALAEALEAVAACRARDVSPVAAEPWLVSGEGESDENGNAKGGTAIVRRVEIQTPDNGKVACAALKEIRLVEKDSTAPAEADADGAEKTMHGMVRNPNAPPTEEESKPSLPPPQRTDRARMEFEVLRRCATSPFVVQMLACEVDAPNLRCRFLLEYCALGDLTRLMSRALRTNAEAAKSRRAAAGETDEPKTDSRGRPKPPPRDFICFSENAVRWVAAHALEALACLHRKGFVFRDMKPENLLARADGHVVLCDFDLSCPIANEKKYRPVSMSGEVGFVGILEYLAPEVVKGNAHTPASDVYQVGVLMYELFVGRSPFRSWTAERSFHMIKSVDIEFPQDTVPPPSDAMVKATSSGGGSASLCHRNPWSRSGGEAGDIDAVFASCPLLQADDGASLRGEALLARTDVPAELTAEM